MADGFQRREPDGLGLAGLEDGQVGRGDPYLLRQFAGGDFGLGQHDIKVDDDGHLLFFFARQQKVCYV